MQTSFDQGKECHATTADRHGNLPVHRYRGQHPAVAAVPGRDARGKLTLEQALELAQRDTASPPGEAQPVRLDP